MTRMQGDPNPSSSYSPGDKVHFHVNGKVVEDTVTGCFWQHATRQPYVENLFYPALALENHSWIGESNVLCPECKGTQWLERKWDSAPVRCWAC